MDVNTLIQQLLLRAGMEKDPEVVVMDTADMMLDIKAVEIFDNGRKGVGIAIITGKIGS